MGGSPLVPPSLPPRHSPASLLCAVIITAFDLTDVQTLEHARQVRARQPPWAPQTWATSWSPTVHARDQAGRPAPAAHGPATVRLPFYPSRYAATAEGRAGQPLGQRRAARVDCRPQLESLPSLGGKGLASSPFLGPRRGTHLGRDLGESQGSLAEGPELPPQLWFGAFTAASAAL